MPALALEMRMLAAAIVLLLVHIMVAGQLSSRDRGLAWNAGPRDAPAPPLGRLAARAQRALDNYKETLPAFLALALALVFTGREGGAGATGAILWLACRLLYLPLYLAGVPWLRSIAYAVSLAGLAMMLARLL